VPILEHDDKVSSPGESRPQTHSESGVNLSAHRAPIIQPTAKSPFASGQKLGFTTTDPTQPMFRSASMATKPIVFPVCPMDQDTVHESENSIQC
jgi:hypothetical protein